MILDKLLAVVALGVLATLLYLCWAIRKDRRDEEDSWSCPYELECRRFFEGSALAWDPGGCAPDCCLIDEFAEEEGRLP